MIHNVPPGQFCDTDNQPCTNKAKHYVEGIGWLCDTHYEEHLQKYFEELDDEKIERLR